MSSVGSLSDVATDELLSGFSVLPAVVVGAEVSGGADVTAVNGGSDEVLSSPFIIL